jgi:hypothetical protein
MYDPLTLAFYSFVLLSIILTIWVVRLEIKLRRLTRGKSGASLEDTILDAHRKLDLLAEFRKDSLAYFKDVEKRLLRSVQAIHTLRFNPFKGTGEGGNQSFSTAIIDERGNGAVLTSLYSRDRVSVFGKPIQGFVSEFELTEEEKESLEQAKNKIA